MLGNSQHWGEWRTLSGAAEIAALVIRGWTSGPHKPTTSLHSCSVFLLDQNELVAKVFDGGVVDDEVRNRGGCREYARDPGEQATPEGCLQSG